MVLSKKFCLPKNGGHFEFSKFSQNTKMLISRKLCYMERTKFLTCWVSLQSSHANFQNIFVSSNIADILNFRIFAKHKNAYILKTVLDRADCADFGCHNSIRLETKHFLNTLALTFISFSGCFVFASDPLVKICLLVFLVKEHNIWYACCHC